MSNDVTVHRAAPAVEAATDAEATSLVRMAIERGVDVAVLERLVALQERVTERNARAAYFEALAEFQEKCPQIAKSKTAKIVSKSGGQFSYTYAPLDEITRTIRPHLKAVGLSYSWDVAAEGPVLVVTAILRHVEGHSERSSFPVPVDKGGRMSDAQATGAALTYGRRQSLVAVLGLTTTDDDIDGVQGNAVEPITAGQVADLDSLIVETKTDKPKFLRYMGVAALADIPAADFQRALNLLEQKRRAAL